MILRHGVLMLSAMVLANCRPLQGTNPLDGNSVSVAAVEPRPIIADGDEASQMQDDRLKRLSTEGGYGTSVRGSAGTSMRSDF